MFGNRAHRRTWFVLLSLGAVLLLALGLRLWRIDSLPPGFHFDESYEGLEAWRILTDAAYRPVFLTGNFGVAPLNAYANALTFGLFQLFGGAPGPTAMRVTAAVLGVLGVLTVYGLAYELRRLDPQRLTPVFPLLAAAALATLRWHIHFSRMGIEPIFTPLLWAAATWLLLRGWRTGGWGAFAICGVLLAAAMYSYQGAWIIPLLMVPVVAHLWLHARKEGKARRRLAGSALAAGVALLLALPLAFFFADNLDLLVLRPAQIAVTGAGGAQTAAATPWENAVRSVLMFAPLGQTGDIDPRRNLPGEAALNWWQFLPFAAGFLLALWRLRNPAYSTILIGLAGLLLPGVFSEYAPHFHRILGAAAPTALLIAVGLDAVLRWAFPHVGVRTERVDEAPARGVQATQAGESPAHPLTRSPAHLRTTLATALVAGLLLAGAIGAARDYFVRWAALPDLFHAFDAGLWQLGQEMARQPADEPLYLSPRPADHPTLAFALTTQPDSHAAPVSFDGRQVFPLSAAVNDWPEHYFVIEHEDFRTPLLLPEVFPTAVISTTIEDSAGQRYAGHYVRPAGAAPQRPPQRLLPQPVNNLLGNDIRLLGYDVQPDSLHPGEVLYLQLHWLVEQTPAEDWVVFTHLLRSDGAGGYVQVAGEDNRPGGGSLPTPRWQEGWRILDEYQIALPDDLPPGVYTLAVGLYQPGAEGAPARLPATGEGLFLGEVMIEQSGTE
jgi:hypothetical protein